MKKLSQYISESKKSEKSSGDSVKITKGKHKGETAEIDLILSDTYVLILSNGNKIEVNHSEID